MAIGVNVLAAGSRGASASSSQATAAFTPTPNALILAFIGTVDATFPAAMPTSAAIANNADIVLTNRNDISANDGGFGDRLSVWTGWNPGDGASGALTWSGLGVSGADTMAWWAVYGLTGVRADQGNTGASLGQTAEGTSIGTTYSGDLTPLDARGDSVVFGFAYHASEELTTPGTGWTEDLDAVVAGGGTGHAEHKLNDPTIDASWATSTTFVVLAYEILAARTLAPPPPRIRHPLLRRPSGLVLARP